MLNNNNIKMNEYINDEIEKMINSSQGCQGMAPLNPKIEKHDFSDQMRDLSKFYNSIINNTEYLKCLLVISLKKVTWKKELMDKFGCSHNTVNYFIDYMKANGLVISKNFVDLDNILYETILRLHTDKLYRQINNTNLIMLTINGEEFVKRIIKDCSKLNRQDIMFNIQEIHNNTRAFRIVYDEISGKENKLGNRLIKYPDGTLVKRRTEAQKVFDKNIQVSLLKFKRDMLLEKNIHSTSLTIIQDHNNKLILLDMNPKSKELRKRERYNGFYSNLNSIDIEKLSEGVNDKDIKQAEKENNIKVFNKLKYQNRDIYSINKLLNKEKETKEDINRNNIEGLDYLDTLNIDNNKEIPQSFRFKRLREVERLEYLCNNKVKLKDKYLILEGLELWYLEMLYINCLDYQIFKNRTTTFRYAAAKDILRNFVEKLKLN
jgi:hypothetical protein